MSCRSIALAGGILAGLSIVVWASCVIFRQPSSAHAELLATFEFKDPAAANVFLGDVPAVINEQVQNVPDDQPLSAFSLRVTYDATLIDVVVDEGPFLGSTGRSTSCIKTMTGPGDLTFGCTSSGDQPGATGSGTLARFGIVAKASLALRAAHNNGIITLLNDHKSDATLTDTSGQSVLVAAALDTVLTLRALEADVDRNCVVNVIDEQIIAVRYGSAFGSLLYAPRFDLEPEVGDFDIDVKDLQFVFGRSGSSCKTPIPGQTPVLPTLTPDIPTAQPSRTMTPSVTATGTPSNTPVPSTTPSETPVPSATPSETNTPVATATETSTPESTVTLGTPTVALGTPTVVHTATVVVTRTITVTSTVVVTRTPVALTPKPTASRTPVSGTSTSIAHTATSTARAGGTVTAVGSTVTRVARGTPSAAASTPAPSATRTPSEGGAGGTSVPESPTAFSTVLGRDATPPGFVRGLPPSGFGTRHGGGGLRNVLLPLPGLFLALCVVLAIRSQVRRR